MRKKSVCSDGGILGELSGAEPGEPPQDTVNGVPVDHYTFDESALNSAAPTPTPPTPTATETMSATLAAATRRPTPVPTEAIRLTPTPAAPPTESPAPQKTITPTATATAVPALPDSFNIDLAFTNSSCGYPDALFAFQFLLDGPNLTLLQTDAGIATTGSYDAGSGAFETSGAVGDGIETYEGVITFDGMMIRVTGTSTYAQDGQCEAVSDIAGVTSVP